MHIHFFVYRVFYSSMCRLELHLVRVHFVAESKLGLQVGSEQSLLGILLDQRQQLLVNLELSILALCVHCIFLIEFDFERKYYDQNYARKKSRKLFMSCAISYIPPS